ncbi:hypothetical protein B0A62_19445 [Flavobacterium hydatis]|uniref:MPN domain-containing protein n=1 Tax=Flavobacterium hydatis TaxID=991 RepID=A0ABX4CAN9_FLAHY|nr:JAB domain-containing protein [Flavobacterium hydatis]OXA90357.1 hypothetical protein B0A62_19445 [Flavobacterium hydatis]
MIKETTSSQTELLNPEWLKSKVVRKMMDMSAGSLQNLRVSQKVRFKKVLSSYYEVSSGGISDTVVDLRLIFAVGLKVNAVSLIMIHNHPLGQQIRPSEPDKQITRKVKEARGILDIVLLDHLIITPDIYYSFADDGAF